MNFVYRKDNFLLFMPDIVGSSILDINSVCSGIITCISEDTARYLMILTIWKFRVEMRIKPSDFM
jgi:hypothetical protein